MEFDLQAMPSRAGYKLLTGVIVPRPIALTTTMDAEGRVNAAPYSFFNMMGFNPPLVVLGPGDRAGGMPKDTARNIATTRSFVINIVDEALAEKMNVTATDFPEGVNELEAAGLTTMPSLKIPVPRIAEAPASLECRQVTTLQVGRTRIVVGEVVHLYLRDDLVDVENGYVRTENLHAIGRMHGGGWYTRTTDLFKLDRIPLEAFQEDK